MEWLFQLLNRPLPEPPETMPEYAVVLGPLIVVVTILWSAFLFLIRTLFRRLVPENRRIAFDGAESAPIWKGREVPHFYLASLWFISAEALLPARSVHAWVEVRSRDGATKSAYCVWAVGTQPSEVGRWKSEETQIDIAADKLPVKLHFAFRNTPWRDNDVPEWWQLNTKDLALYEVPRDAIRLHVTLRGIQTHRTFDFAIRRLDDENFDVEHITWWKKARAVLVTWLLPSSHPKRLQWSW